MTLFSLLTVFSATLAWFALNQKVDSNGMMVRIKDQGKIMSGFTVHRCRLNESSATVLKFYETPMITVNSDGTVVSGDDADIDDYSSLSRAQPTLLLFTFAPDTQASAINIKAKTETITTLPDVTSENVNHFPFSYSVCFKSGLVTTDDFPFDNVMIASLNQTAQFVTIDNHAITGLVQDIDIFVGSGNDVVTYVAVVMDYLPDAIEYIISLNIDSEDIPKNNNRIDFYCDWIMEL